MGWGIQKYGVGVLKLGGRGSEIIEAPVVNMDSWRAMLEHCEALYRRTRDDLSQSTESLSRVHPLVLALDREECPLPPHLFIDLDE